MSTLTSRFVEVGRVVRVQYGDDLGKLGVITDIVDQNTCVIDGPEVSRQVINYKRIALTEETIKIVRGQRTPGVVKAFNAAGVAEKFAKSKWGQKYARNAKRASMSDFDRFKVMVARKKRSKLLSKENIKKQVKA